MGKAAKPSGAAAAGEGKGAEGGAAKLAGDSSLSNADLARLIVVKPVGGVRCACRALRVLLTA